MTRLNLGCGRDIKPGFVNVDAVPMAGVDCVVDLKEIPWPFEDGSTDYIYASHVFEHLPMLTWVVFEVARILKPGGIAFVRAPHYRSENAFTDSTHIVCFTPHTFDYWCEGTFLHEHQSYLYPAIFKKEKVQLVRTYPRPLSRWPSLLQFVFPPEEIQFTLRRNHAAL